MNMKSADKLALMDKFFDILLADFRPATIGEHVRHAAASPQLASFTPQFRH
jgi:hypothetical protein